MNIMEGQGVGGHVGDESSPSLCLVFSFSRSSQMVLTQCDSRAVLGMSKVVRNAKQARTNDRRNHDSHNGSHVCSECQSGSKQARVNGKSQMSRFLLT